MGVYTRFKRTPDGFRQLVELIETTPAARRKKMIDVGMQEDPDYTQEALSYMMTFEDILALPDNELAELLSKAAPRTVAFAIKATGDDVKTRFIKCAKAPANGEIKDYLGATCSLSETGGAQFKLIEIARLLEKKGFIKTKHIPEGHSG